jgi:GT2 family glycosyltransferase
VSSVSAIVTTYERPGHLRRCVASLEVQTRPPDEIVIADDGSGAAHQEAVREIMRACPLDVRYVRQEDLGHRPAASRNNGARSARGDLLLFLDADVVMLPDAVAQHETLSEGRFWTPGNAVRLDADQTAALSEERIREGKLDELWPPPKDPRVAKLARMEAKFRGRSQDRWLRLFEGRMRKLRLITIQCGVPRSAFERVNGFDERYVGWGREDHDLSLRLQLAGVRGRSAIAAARAFHQYHAPAERPGLGEEGPPRSVNDAYFERRRWWRFRCRDGLQAR